MTTKRHALTFERAHELLRYEPETGKLFWRVAPGSVMKAGSEAGCIQSNGYLRVQIGGRKMQAHRLIFFMQTGRWPIGDVDHMDGDRQNNAWCNLRECDRRSNSENCKRASRNSVTGVLGVSPKRGRYVAQISVSGQKRHLGYYDTVQDAQAAYLEAKTREHAGYVA